MSNVRQEDIAEILNKINEALEETGCWAVGYDNTGALKGQTKGNYYD